MVSNYVDLNKNGSLNMESKKYLDELKEKLSICALENNTTMETFQVVQVLNVI